MEIEQKWRELRDSRFFEEFYFILIALLLAFGVISTSGELLDTDRPVVTVTSCSMYPVYDVGDLIVVKGEDYSEYSVDDVIVYDAEDRSLNIPVIHRVVEKNEEYLQTKGDNSRGQLEFEKRVEPDQIHGEARFSVPKVGAVKLLAMDLIGYGGTNIGNGPNPPVLMDNQYFCTERI